MAEKNFFMVKPYGEDSIDNEHWVCGVGPDFEDETGNDMTWEITGRLMEIFPDGDDRGNRIEIHRPPTEDELIRLKNLAVEFGVELKTEVRSEEQYQEMRREQRKRADRL